MTPQQLARDINHAVSSNKDFGMAIFPGETVPQWFGGDSTYSHATMEIAPWLCKYENRAIIGRHKSDAAKCHIPEHSTTPDEYLCGVTHVIESCRNRIGKTVYSRIICGQLECSRIGNVAAALFNAHPMALRFIYRTETTGMWLGATPELLLDFDKTTGSFRTMAFAGTRKRTKDMYIEASIPWDEKNLRENRFVIDYIVKALASLGVTAQVSPLETVTYGEIEHLCAHISGQASPHQLPDIIDAINPTPAICGWPKVNAIEDISRYELHDRGCYGGFIGFSTPQRYRAFVNLRSMQWDNGRFCIYGGGGITPQSEPEAEYDETESKTKILRTIVSGQ